VFVSPQDSRLLSAAISIGSALLDMDPSMGGTGTGTGTGATDARSGYERWLAAAAVAKGAALSRRSSRSHRQ
jgi:hypothetical protein